MLIIFQDLRIGYYERQSSSCAPVTPHSHTVFFSLVLFNYFSQSPISLLSVHLPRFYLDRRALD